MAQAFRDAIDRLPQIIEKNAPGMMRRMVARMKTQLAELDHDGSASHGSLFLKVGEENLVEHFGAAAHATFGKKEDSDLAGLSLEPEGGPAQDLEFTASTAAFTKLCADAAQQGVRSLDRFNKDAFVRAMEDAFKRSRMDERATSELMSFAKSALDVELQAIYTKLDQLAVSGQ